MSDGLAQSGFSPTTQHHVALLVATLGLATVLSIAVVTFSPVLALVPFAILGAAMLWRAVRYTATHPTWLVGPLIVIELLTAAWFFSGATRALFPYGLTALFCLPMLPLAWRNRGFVRDGFAFYVCYFLWAAISVTYSLAPAFSAGRLFDAILVFAALGYVVTRIKEPDDVPALLTPLLVGCSVVVLIVAVSYFALPRSLTWLLPGEVGAEDVEFPRFCAIFNGPNDVGELMLVTVGCAAALWPWVRGKRRWLLAVISAIALGAAAMADSRTPFVALAVGATCYFVWKYRGRALVALLLLTLIAGAMHFRLGSDDYLARGDVSTLTGRTDVWDFAVSQIKQSPVLGYGYEVGGAILQSRYFPVWWGPWDEGPHSSLHNGYIDRAVGVGVPAPLLWFFFILRPWYAVFKRPDDRWQLKPIVFWMFIPMLVHNLTEVSISDCTGMIGLGFFLIWAIAEQARIIERERERADRAAQHAALSPAAAALTAGVLVMLATTSLPATAHAQSTYHFPTLPPHAALTSGAACAVAASNGSPWEPRPGNYKANHTVPTFVELVGFHLAPLKGSSVPITDFVRVDGNFTGTTDQILRWGACKWGIDEDVVRAEAVAESHWRQDDVGDVSYDRSICPPGGGFPGAWDGSSCQQSYGIMQVKFRDFGGWPLPKDSTAFNVDFRLAYQRACMNGDIAYLAEQSPMGDYPPYPRGSTEQMLWGCMGDWYSGSWYDTGAINYIAEVKAALVDRTWTKMGF